jgi:hypothetical protein
MVILFTLALSSLALLIMMGVTSEQRSTENYLGIQQAADAADGGIEYGVARLWGNFLTRLNERPGDLPTYRAFLDRIVENRATEDILPREHDLQSGAKVLEILASRRDEADGTVITLRATAESKGRTRVATQTLIISGATFEGMDYAVLANNLDCVMCHASIDNVRRVYNKDPDLYGTFDKVKVASLDDLRVRAKRAHTKIAGALFTRGDLLVRNGNGPYRPSDNLSKGTVRSAKFDENGNLEQNKKGDTRGTKFESAGLMEDGSLDPHANLYTNYPDAPDEMSAGTLPATLPPVVPDTNGNRLVDDVEWKKKVSEASMGSLTGGTAFGVRPGDEYKEQDLPKKSNAADQNLGKGGYLDGNVILVGTDRDPINLNGNIAVNGDVVITGKVKGKGEILARNNIYFVGDVTYADGDEFGKAKGGEENIVAFAAGGNIVAGDYITPQAYNKLEYKKNRSVYFDDSRGKKFPEYLSKETIDTSPPLDEGYYTSFASAQLMNFNQREFAMAAANADYTPRYYNLREGDRTYMLGTNKVDHANEYDSSFVRVLDEKALQNAAVLSLNPKGGWLSDMQLKEFWAADYKRRPKKDKSERLRIDGLLYSSNAILATAHSYKKHRSPLHGSMQIRGAVIGADVGILAPGDKNKGKFDQGLNIYYDDRVKGLLNMQGTDALAMRRGFRLFEYPQPSKEARER